MEQVKSDFALIVSHPTLRDFVGKYGLVDTRPANREPSLVLGVFEGTTGEHSILVTHSWYDRCKTYQIRPDGNDVTIEVRDSTGAVVYSASASFLDDR